MNLVKDIVHRIADRTRHGTVDRRGGRLVLQGTGIGHDPAGRNRAAAQGPQELVEIMIAFRLDLDLGKRFGDTPIRVVDACVDVGPVFCRQPVLRIPDIQRRGLEFDVGGGVFIQIHGRLHRPIYSPLCPCGEPQSVSYSRFSKEKRPARHVLQNRGECQSSASFPSLSRHKMLCLNGHKIMPVRGPCQAIS